MIFVLGKPIVLLMEVLTDSLNQINTTTSILLGAIMGLMTAFDMVGPLIKWLILFRLVC